MSYMLNKQKTKFNTIVILEKDSGINIVIKNPTEKANTLVRKLNLGSGFKGWTPDFFARPMCYK